MFVCPVHVLSTCKCIYCNHNKNKSTFFALFTNNLSARTYIHAIGNCVSTISTSRDVLVQKSLSKKSHCMHLFQLTAFFSIFSLVLIVSTCGGIFTQLESAPNHIQVYEHIIGICLFENVCVVDNIFAKAMTITTILSSHQTNFILKLVANMFNACIEF